jgi:hypothetical protein
MRAWERTDSTTSAVDQVRTVQELIRDDIERMCPRRNVAAAQPAAPPRLEFSGAETSVQFLGPAPVAAGGRTCASMAFHLAPAGAHTNLMLRLRNGVNGTSDAELLRQVQSVEFAYLARGRGWQSRWTGRADLPDLIRLRVTFPKGDSRVWPELFIHPRISAEADCNYDAATQSCRGG